MSGFDPKPAAAALIAARHDRRPAGPLAPRIAPRDVIEAAAVQAAIARAIGAFPPGGFKIGATGTRMQAMLGLPGPAAGFMAAADIQRSGAALAFAACRGPGVECEIAVTLARDLPPGPCSREQAAAAVGSV